jgi:hypothetical protein
MNKLLPERPNLGHLKDQARDLVQARQRRNPEAIARIRAYLPRLSQASDAEILGADFPLHDALWIIAREYGFDSWPKLKAAIEVKPETVDAMRKAIDEDKPAKVRELLATDPNIVNSYLARTTYYLGNQRPLAYAGQRGRTEIVKLLLEAGADIHAEGNLAIARSSMDSNISIMEMFLAHGMDVNCAVHGWGPLLTYPAETQQPVMLKWLLDHGADPNLRMADTKCRENAWEALIGGYDRSSRFHECVNVLIDGGAKYKDGPYIDLYRGQFRDFARKLERDAAIARNRYDLIGANLSLRDTTLLHLCADWNFLEAAKVLLAHGADINAPAPIDADGIGGHTPIFHTVNSIFLWSFPILEWLLAQGADLSVRVTVRWVDKIYREVTPLGYALQAKRKDAECERVVELLKRYGARE